MARSTYHESLRRLLLHEGGYTNHPSDPGGPTNFGITLVDYRKYAKPNATAADVRAMKIADAKNIYRAKYWDAQRCDDLPAGVDYAVFDYGVNSGIGRSGKVLRRVLRLPDNTSVVNDAVIAAARVADAKTLVTAMCDERLRFLQSLKTWAIFGKGWGRRVAEVRAAAMATAAGVPAQTSLPQAPAQARAVVPVAKAAQQGSAGAIAAAGAGAAQQAHEAGARPAVVAAIVVVAAAFAIAGWVYWHRHQRRQQERRV